MNKKIKLKTKMFLWYLNLNVKWQEIGHLNESDSWDIPNESQNVNRRFNCKHTKEVYEKIFSVRTQISKSTRIVLQ